MSRGTGFKRPEFVRTPPSAPRPATRRAVLANCAAAAPAIEKVVPVEHEGYRRLVALLPCKICGIDGHSQAAHPNTDKGTGTKTDDRLCFPLCCDRPGVRGCHPQFDQHALLSKAARRAIEPAWGADTRRQIAAMGLWPKSLPIWSDA
ncbi:hypothetical protein J7E70_02145 [Variovorax paradoxus]|nr:hypothetical protein [Variovorax paradoxus]MBT2299255.1 hypothetical protein [Variovorax paradoxus]